jgi:hypothetical protein
MAQLVEPEQFMAWLKEVHPTFQRTEGVLHFKDGRVFEQFFLSVDLSSGRIGTSVFVT